MRLPSAAQSQPTTPPPHPNPALRAHYNAYVAEGFTDHWYEELDDEQLKVYPRYGMAKRPTTGLWITCFVAWDMRAKETPLLLDEWWLQNMRHTTEDQISFPYVLWKYKVLPTTLQTESLEVGVLAGGGAGGAAVCHHAWMPLAPPPTRLLHLHMCALAVYREGRRVCLVHPPHAQPVTNAVLRRSPSCRPRAFSSFSSQLMSAASRIHSCNTIHALRRRKAGETWRVPCSSPVARGTWASSWCSTLLYRAARRVRGREGVQEEHWECGAFE